MQKICWATAQLCHNTMGNCIVTQQVLGMLFGLEHWVTIQLLYCDIGGWLGWLRYWVTIHGLYCDQEGLQKGILYRD